MELKSNLALSMTITESLGKVAEGNRWQSSAPKPAKARATVKDENKE